MKAKLVARTAEKDRVGVQRDTFTGDGRHLPQTTGWRKGHRGRGKERALESDLQLVELCNYLPEKAADEKARRVP